MSIALRIILIIASILLAWYILRKIRKSQMIIEDSIFWVLISFALIIISLFPNIAYELSNLIGIGSPVNFVYLVIIFILLVKVFFMSIRISQLEHKIKIVVQNIAIQNYSIRTEFEEIAATIEEINVDKYEDS